MSYQLVLGTFFLGILGIRRSGQGRGTPTRAGDDSLRGDRASLLP